MISIRQSCCLILLSSGFASTIASAALTYYGGPIASNAEVVMVNWGSLVPSSAQVNLPYFYTDITQSDYWAVMTQYATTLNGSDGQPGSNQQLGFGTFKGSYVIAPSLCNTASNCTVTDVQIGNELAAQITANNLPGATTDGAGHADTIYMVHFPVNVTISQNGSHSCSVFCATFTNFTTANLLVAAGLIPDQGGACASGCGGGAGAYLDIETDVTAHELANIVTDPQIPSASGNARPIAWYNPASGDIADICLDASGTVSANGHPYWVPKIWSKHNAACVLFDNHYVVKPSATSGGSISPSMMTAVVVNAPLEFSVIPDMGKFALVGGSCGGALAGSVYTTLPVTADCTVTMDFTEIIFKSGFESL